jgi:hypothetical protein
VIHISEDEQEADLLLLEPTEEIFSECNIEPGSLVELNEGFYFSAVLPIENGVGSRASLPLQDWMKLLKFEQIIDLCVIPTLLIPVYSIICCSIIVQSHQLTSQIILYPGL